MTEAELLALKNLPAEAKQLSVEDLSQGWPDYQITSEALAFWSTRYRELTGTNPVVARDLVELVRDHGDAVIQLHQRPIRIGITTYSAREFDKLAAKQLIGAILGSLEAEGISLADVAIVSGLTNLGGVQAAYDAAAQYPAVERQGIASGKGILFETAQVDQAVLIGADWGAESPLFLNTVNFMIGIGGGGQAESELNWFIRRSPDRTILAEGFFETKGDQQLPGAADRVAESGSGTRIQDSAVHPIEKGTQIGKHLAAVFRRSQGHDQNNVLMSLALPSNPDNLVDIEAWAEAHRQRYRIIRVLRAVQSSLPEQGMTEGEMNELLLDLGNELLSRTSAIDHVQQNALWQEEVRAVIREATEASDNAQLRSLVEALEVDILFASWFGQQKVSAEPNYYDAHHRQVAAADYFSPRPGSLSFNLDDYVELRFDLATRAYLLSPQGRGEIFLGSKHDMNLYYRSKGFEPAQRLSDSNGTVYYLLKKADDRLFVAQGVDSPSRLNQVVSIMAAAGVDVENKISIRGDMQRLRDLNRDFLEIAISNLSKPVVGVVIGDKNNVLSSLSGQLNVGHEKLRVLPPQEVGPYRFEAIEVQVEGMPSPGYILAFAPAYGQLSYDLARAAYNSGVRSFFLAGAGGTLAQNGAIGELQRVVSTEVNGEILAVNEVREIQLLEVPGAVDSTNIFSPSPFEQTANWIDAQRSRGFSGTDQETGLILKAITESIETDKQAGLSPSVNLSSALYISDDFKGRLASGTVDVGYRRSIHERLPVYLNQIGITSITLNDGRTLDRPPSGQGERAIVSGRTSSSFAQQVPIPDRSRVSQNQAAGTIQQFRGERRVVLIESQGMGPRDRRFLEEFLSSIRSTNFWIVVRQGDPHHSEILEISSALGFQNVLIASNMQAVRVAPDFIYSVQDDAAEKQTASEFIRDGKNDSYETNTAKHFHLVVGSQNISTGSPHILYSADLDPLDAEELAEPLRKDIREGRKRLRGQIQAHFNEELEKQPPQFLEIHDIGEAFQGKVPVSIMGASKKAWPLISEAAQENVINFIREYLSELAPRQHVIVTGGTDFGVEEHVHRIANELGFEIVSTITENTQAAELSPHVSRVVLTGINWFGISRSLFEDILIPHNGEVIFIGGGAILRDSIELAAKTSVPFRLMKGPEGAANELSTRYPTHAFETVHDLNRIKPSSLRSLSCKEAFQLLTKRRSNRR
ncbi:MAG: hypothetical protein EA369_09565 [Bradymonadales bacterium]|nr:MAG: hypothetical protein EA369_09565 [Bradymonadales bacterium]